MAADAHDIVCAPARGRAAGECKLARGGQFARGDIGDIGVDPGDERLGLSPGRSRIMRPFGGHIAAIEQQPRRAILRRIRAAEAGGKQA